MSQRVLIIGAGEIGKALAAVLKQSRNAEIRFWDKKSRSSADNLDDLVRSAQFIFLCVPSSALAQVISEIKPRLRRRTLVVSLTKGIDKQTGQFSGEILRRQFGRVRTAVLAGPMIAEELRTGIPTRAMVGSTKKNFRKLVRLFEETTLCVEHSSDVRGVSMAGVLKNIYTMGFGMINALKLGSNAKGVFTNSALLEMEQIISQLGGQPETAHSLAGLGDFEATGHSPDSANQVAGRRIVEGKLGKLTAEGLLSLEPLVKRIGTKNLPPALSAVRKTIKNPRKAREIFENFIKNG